MGKRPKIRQSGLAVRVSERPCRAATRLAARPRRWWVAAAFALGLALFTATPAAAADVVVTDLRIGEHTAKTRIVLEVSREVRYSVFTLSDPDRVVIDLPEVGWRLPARPLPEGTGVVARLRYGLFKPGQTRVVLDVSAPVTVVESFLIEPAQGRPYRLVVDLAAAKAEAAIAQPGGPLPLVEAKYAPASLVAPAPFPVPPRKPLQARAVRVIAIDPGHGGADPGAIGASGAYEKHITLAAARTIKEALERTGRFQVFLTRDRDVFVSLRDRVELARQAGAELFLSIHADTIRDTSVRGLSVYTLSETASDKEAAALAEKENKSDLIGNVDLSNETLEVTNILIDLAQRESMNQSAHFAGIALEEFGREGKLLRNTHRFAGFAVLKAPDVPSILVELGFLSNRQDEKALTQKAHRARLAAAVTRAVERYFDRVEEASRH